MYVLQRLETTTKKKRDKHPTKRRVKWSVCLKIHQKRKGETPKPKNSENE